MGAPIDQPQPLRGWTIATARRGPRAPLDTDDVEELTRGVAQATAYPEDDTQAAVVLDAITALQCHGVAVRSETLGYFVDPALLRPMTLGGAAPKDAPGRPVFYPVPEFAEPNYLRLHADTVAVVVLCVGNAWDGHKRVRVAEESAERAGVPVYYLFPPIEETK